MYLDRVGGGASGSQKDQNGARDLGIVNVVTRIMYWRPEELHSDLQSLYKPLLLFTKPYVQWQRGGRRLSTIVSVKYPIVYKSRQLEKVAMGITVVSKHPRRFQ